MGIRFVLRSEFLEPCVRAIEGHRKALGLGKVVAVELKPGGYAGRVRVVIDGADRHQFMANWESEPTRFPQRIRTAATALRDCGEYGTFEIVHHDGRVEIRRFGRARAR